ncbi:DUF4056 domain-containing protein [Vibrio breoganii]|uniref:DUF4056 domain-containing protein n=1 Tax=Vibrio breoganii TaxID=553239 RepID=UPI000C838808|nr:DUF4056 domain-containing protein [Vibrio breoganii]PMI18038.1 hypothetical protein BCU49_01195 [Vibrio breoganii]PML59715.1 hypothetical protein BCT73_09645 [Vibrio breoganii]PMO82134.1 hypothetical protein BCT00_09535 [Vibrio breoganii]
MKLKSLLIAGITLFSSASYAIDVPSGVRPCCAFGINMKSELGVVPVPFFRVKNIVELSDLEDHLYNDGEQGVASSLMGTGDESNGLIYTSKGGIIDTAHVRDTADYTLYLHSQISGQLGTKKQVILEDELRSRVIEMTDKPVDMTPEEQAQAEIELSGLLAYRLAQWHEVAQWFGFTSVAGFKEYPSAYSPEDLYSNMLGAFIAIEILETNSNPTKEEYQQAFSEIFLRKLTELGAQDEDRTEEIMDGLDKKWWDSGKRLPNKWVVKTRDYEPRLTITPHWGDSDNRVTTSLSEYEYLEEFGYLTLVATDSEKNFSALPGYLKERHVWTKMQFSEIAQFAKKVDDQHKLNNNQLLPPY